MNYQWSFGAAGTTTQSVRLGMGFDFEIISAYTDCQTVPTTAGSVDIKLNGITKKTISPINNNVVQKFDYTSSTIPVAMDDQLQLQTTAGSGGGVIRIVLTCRCQGVVGPTPNLSVGTVTTSGSTAAVSITGTSTNPVLNFNFVSPSADPTVQALVQKTQNQSATSGYTEFQGTINLVNVGAPCQYKFNGTSIDDFYANKGTTQTDINNINANISNIYDDINDINTAATALSGVVAGISATIYTPGTGLEDVVAGLVVDVGTLDGTVAGLSSDVTAINGDITTIQDQVQNITATPAETNIYGNISTTSIALNSVNAKTTNLGINAAGDILMDGGNSIQLTAPYIDAFGSFRTNYIGSTTSLSVNASTAITCEAPTVTLQSPAGFGAVNIGGLTDQVYLSGLPVSLIFWGQW